MDPEFVGPIGLARVVPTLVILPLIPLLAATLAMLPPVRRSDAIRRTLLAAPFLSFVAAILHALLLVRAPAERRYLFQHVANLVRIGQLDVNFDLAMDSKSAAIALLTLGAAAFAFAREFRSQNEEAVGALIGANVALGGLLFVVLFDSIPPLVFGLVLAAAGSAGQVIAHAGYDVPIARRWVALSVAVAALVGGFGFLFWGQGGVWVGGEYTPELNPRIDAALVTSQPRLLAVPGAPSEPSIRVDDRGVTTRLDVDRERRAATVGTGYLSFSGYPGATLFVDESRSPYSNEGVIVRSPFARLPIPGGYHTFRIHPGAMLDDYIVRNLAVGGERDHALVLFGPTTSPREVRDQLVVIDGRGDHAYANALRTKMGAGRIPLIAIVLACFAVAGIALFFAFDNVADRPGVHRFVAPITLVALAVALEPIAGLAMPGQIVVAMGGAFASLIGLAELLGVLGPRSAPASKLAAGLGLLFVTWSDAPSACVILAVGIGADLMRPDADRVVEARAHALRLSLSLVVAALLLEALFFAVPFVEIRGSRASVALRIVAIFALLGAVAYSASLPVSDESEADTTRGLRRLRALLGEECLRFVVGIVTTVAEVERWVLGAFPDVASTGARALAWLGARTEHEVETRNDSLLAAAVSDEATEASPELTSAIGPILLVVGSAIALYYLLFAG